MEFSGLHLFFPLLHSVKLFQLVLGSDISRQLDVNWAQLLFFFWWASQRTIGVRSCCFLSEPMGCQGILRLGYSRSQAHSNRATWAISEHRRFFICTIRLIHLEHCNIIHIFLFWNVLASNPHLTTILLLQNTEKSNFMIDSHTYNHCKIWVFHSQLTTSRVNGRKIANSAHVMSHLMTTDDLFNYYSASEAISMLCSCEVTLRHIAMELPIPVMVVKWGLLVFFPFRYIFSSSIGWVQSGYGSYFMGALPSPV